MSAGYVGAEAAPTACHVTSLGGKACGKGEDLRNRPGVAPSQGFQACQIIVAECKNEKSNGVYFPAVPYAGKPVWQKPPSDHAMDGEESKDSGERFLYYSEKAERWYIGDALEEGGFSFVLSPGKSPMPPLQGWQQDVVLACESVSDDGIDYAAALLELPKLRQIQPWEDQEVCYVTMLKLLGNIVANPGEAKFRSFKLENAAIQKKVLRHDGARGYFEAVGFREDGGALVFPTDRTAQAKMAHEMLEGFANEAQYAHIRKERHSKAKEEAKKEAEKDSWAQARNKANAKAAEESKSSKGGG